MTQIITNTPVIIYCDGACKGNGKQQGGIGGWGFLILDALRKETLLEGWNGQLNTTNNQMELTAAIQALKATSPGTSISVFTDSSYVVNGITSWISGWKRNGWRTKTGPVKNLELWKELDALVSARKTTFHWVKGHSADPFNDRADTLANLGAADAAMCK